MPLWSRVSNFIQKVWEKLKVIDYIGAALAILKASKKQELPIDDRYIVIRPRLLSDKNMLRGVAGLRAVLSLIPPAAMGATVLSIGEVGFKIWKHIALSKEYDQLEFPPIDPNMLRLAIQIDPELKKYYGELTLTHNWDEEAISTLEKIYNDFSFITNFEMLRAKHPHIDEDYIKTRAMGTRHALQTNLNTIEQSLIKVSHSPEIEHNVREAFVSVKELFPAMNDWALFNSEGFDEVIEIIDTIF